MKKILLSVIGLTALFFVSACGSNNEEVTPEDAYENSCAMCHGQDLSGGNGGPALDGVGSEYTEEEIVEIIENGKGGMPAGQATGERAEEIAAWLAKQE